MARKQATSITPEFGVYLRNSGEEHSDSVWIGIVRCMIPIRDPDKWQTGIGNMNIQLSHVGMAIRFNWQIGIARKAK
jgi:hypothetical protein